MTTTVNPAPKPDRADDATERLRAAVLAKRTPTLSIGDERRFRDLQAQGRNDEAARLLKDRSRDFRAEGQAIVRMNQGELWAYDAALERGDRQGQLRVVGAMVQRVSRERERQTDQALER